MSESKYKLEDAMGVVDAANGCEEHPSDVSPTADEVAEVLFYSDDINEPEEPYAGTDSRAVLRLKDGRIVVARESSDSSGHG